MGVSKLVSLLVLIGGLVAMTTGYKHVVFMHGILSTSESFDYFQSLVQKYHPGTKTTNINMYDDFESITPMWTQVHHIAKKVNSILTDKTSGGTILICYSQGNLVCRGLLSILDHNVETFISLSGPLAGQFGDTQYLRKVFPFLLRDNLYRVLYTEVGQKTSLGNYWYDPRHLDLFEKYSKYLGPLNNQTTQPNPNSEAWRKNFIKVKNFVLIGGPDDGVITPWQSSHFGMYDADMTVQPYQKQPWYAKDSFGFATLDAAKAIHLITVAGVQHHHWHTNVTIFDSYIKPWLD